MKLVAVNQTDMFNLMQKKIDRNPKIAFGDYVKIPKHRKKFAKGYSTNCYQKAFEIKKFKNIVLSTYVIRDLNGEKIV